jgi:hypothetical protein
MLKYYAWAAAEKALSVVPGGNALYRGVALFANRGDRSRRRLRAYQTGFSLTRKARELTPPGGTIVDLGTGWHHHLAILLWLADPSYRIITFDVQDKARLPWIRTYLRHLLEHIDELAAELAPFDREEASNRLKLLLSLENRTEIHAQCGFTHVVSTRVEEPFLPTKVDFIVSDCVLTHIPPVVAVRELRALRAQLKPSGAMYHLIGHQDHHTFHAPGVNQFNYYRYSDRTYKALFQSSCQYQNRLTWSEWLPLFDAAGLTVAEDIQYATPESTASVRALPHIDERFARYLLEELATVHSYALLTL